MESQQIHVLLFVVLYAVTFLAHRGPVEWASKAGFAKDLEAYDR